MTTRIKVTGVESALKALEEVSLSVYQTKTLAAKAAGAVVADVARARAPRRTGNLASRIGVKASARGQVATAKVASSSPHGAIVSAGTGPRMRASGGSTGVMPANHYLEDSLSEAEPAAVDAARTVYRAAIEQVVR